MAQENICIFGDSITWGGYDPLNGGWVTLLRNYLEDKYDECTTYNLGICGDDSSGLLKRFATESKSRKPSIVVIAIGANDVKHQPQVQADIGKYKNNLEHIINQALRITKKILIVGITPVDEKLTTPRNKPPYNFRENKDIVGYNTIAEQLAVSKSIHFVSIPSDFGLKDLADGLHPNTNGHQKIYSVVRPVVDKLIAH